MNKEAAMRYRRLVLEKGGTQKPLDVLENLLGERLDGENLCD
jgi:Zn-dependent oligopeptidase